MTRLPLIPIALVVVLLVAATGIWLSFTLMHMLLTLAVAGIVGYLADLVVPGELPYGWLGAVVAGLVGGWLGAIILGNMGPNLFGVRILPAFVGAAILAAAVEIIGKSAARRQRNDSGTY